MISVVACEPALPPEEMISGMKDRQHGGVREGAFIVAHHAGGEYLAQEKHHQPDRAFFHHAQERRLRVGIVERFAAAELLDILGVLFFLHIEHVVDGDDAEQFVFRIDDRERRAIVFLELADGRLFIIGGAESHEAVIADRSDLRIERGQQEFADADVVDQPPALVHYVDDVQRLGIAAEDANVIEHLRDGPIVVDADEVGRHQAADAVLGIVEKRLGDLALPRGERSVSICDDGRAGQVFEQRRAVVRRHVVEDARGLLGAHRFQHALLLRPVRGIRTHRSPARAGAGGK